MGVAKRAPAGSVPALPCARHKPRQSRRAHNPEPNFNWAQLSGHDQRTLFLLLGVLMLSYLLTYLLTFVLTYLLSHSDGVPVVASLSARRRARRRRGAPWLARRCTSAQTRATSPLSSIRATRHAPARISPSCARAPCAQRPAVFARPPRYSLSECVLAVRGVATTTAQSSTALSRTL